MISKKRKKRKIRQWRALLSRDILEAWEVQGCCLGSLGYWDVPGCHPQPGEAPWHGGTERALMHGPKVPQTQQVPREVFWQSADITFSADKPVRLSQVQQYPLKQWGGEPSLRCVTLDKNLLMGSAGGSRDPAPSTGIVWQQPGCVGPAAQGSGGSTWPAFSSLGVWILLYI